MLGDEYVLLPIQIAIPVRSARNPDAAGISKLSDDVDLVATLLPLFVHHAHGPLDFVVSIV